MRRSVICKEMGFAYETPNNNKTDNLENSRVLTSKVNDAISEVEEMLNLLQVDDRDDKNDDDSCISDISEEN